MQESLGGFLLIINDNGEIYYASENVEQFLGFHQSDILHQPLYDLIHSEDREDIRQQIDLSFTMPPGCTNQQDLYNPENVHYLDRNVNARFRCLLDNTCGFLRIDMRGKLLSLHGLPSSYVLGRSNTGPVMGLVAVCTPFVPPSSPDSLAEDLILKTKHHLDGTLVSMDDKVHAMLELDESELPVSFYHLVHVEDAVCLAEAHKEVIKNGSSGLLIYRLISTKTNRTYFVQSSCRMFYKNGKPESIGLTHRLLNEVEGTMLLEKRSSLKAKLLSFDDSFLQSPRNLQSTAALPLPTVREEQDDGSSFSTPLSLPNSRFRKKTSEFHLLDHSALASKMGMEQWPLLQPGEFAHFPLPPGLSADLTSWTSETTWSGEQYTPYPVRHLPVSYPQSNHPLPPLPTRPTYNEIGMECTSWNQHAPLSTPLVLPDIFPLEDPACLLVKDPRYPLPSSFSKPISEYPIAPVAPVPPQNGFNLISEVTNTLLGQ